MTPHEELTRRLATDRPTIEATFNGGRSCGDVRRVEAGLSDPHDGGRTVAAVTFENGLRVIYKPRPMGLEAAFRQLVEWWNRGPGNPDLRAAGVVDRGAYGWMEYVPHESGADRAAADRYYERAGAIVFLAWLLDATDLHHGNVIAHGEHPVLVDLETLLHPRRAGEERSVLDTGLVPAWIRAPDGERYDVSGFGAIADQQYAGRIVPVRQNVVRVGGEVASPAGFSDRIESGFRRAAAALLSARNELLATTGPLAAFDDRPVRVLLRHTLTYTEALGTGNRTPAGPLLQPVYDAGLEHTIRRAEERALGAGDIPRFTASTGSADWTPVEGLTVPAFFGEASKSGLLDRVRRLDAGAVEEQARVVTTALALWEVGNLMRPAPRQAGAATPS